MSGGAWDAPAASLVEVSAALAARSDRFEELLAGARDAGVSPRAMEEALLQSYLFLGYPSALNALATWRRVSGEPPGARDAAECDAWPERGASVCRTVYAGQYERLRENVRALHPDLETWMVAEGYGKVLGRPGLDLRLRELCVVAVLVVQGFPTQLYSHLRGALNAGVGEAAVEEALGRAGRFAGAAERRAAWDTWARVRSRGSGGAGAP